MREVWAGGLKPFFAHTIQADWQVQENWIIFEMVSLFQFYLNIHSTLFVTDSKCNKKFAVFWPFSLFLEDMYYTIPLVKMKIHERIIIKFKICNLVEISL